MPKKQDKPPAKGEDRVFRVSLTSKDRDIKEFKNSYRGNFSNFVREAVREKIQREHLMTRTQKRPRPPEQGVAETPKLGSAKKADRLKMPPLPSKTVLTEEEIRNGLLNNGDSTF